MMKSKGFLFPQEDVVRIYNGILLSHKKEWNCAICINMDGPRDCHTERRESDGEGEILYGISYMWNRDFPGGSDGKASVYGRGDPGLIHGLGRSLGEGNGNPFQYSCLENPMDRGAWQATAHGVAKSRTRLSDFTFTFTFICGM